MNYLKKRLAAGETILHEGRFHWIHHAVGWFYLLVLGILIIGIVLWIMEMFRLHTTEFVVTNRRVMLKRGYFNVKVDEITLDSIEGARIARSFWGRLFGFGRLTVRGSGDTQLMFPSMADPDAFRIAAEGGRMQAGVLTDQPAG